MISAGHGVFTTYSFKTKKKDLEAAVMKVIEQDSNIYREPEASQEYKDIYKKATEEQNKELKDGALSTDYVDYYNDGKNYLTIKLKHKNYKYTFRYIGDEKYWEKSSDSEFYIVYIWDENNRGGGYKDKLEPEFVKKLADEFEIKFVDKVSNQLGIPFTKRE